MLLEVGMTGKIIDVFDHGSIVSLVLSVDEDEDVIGGLSTIYGEGNLTRTALNDAFDDYESVIGAEIKFETDGMFLTSFQPL